MLKLLKKLIKPKSKKELTERDLLGRDHVGYPTMQLNNMINSVAVKYPSKLKPIIQFYEQVYFFKWMPGVLNQNLSDEQLKDLSGRHVQIVYLLLFRDMLRKIAPFMPQQNMTENWPDLFADEVFQMCKISADLTEVENQKVQSLFASDLEYDIEAESTELDCLPAWANTLSQFIFIPEKALYDTHKAINLAILKKLKKPKKAKSTSKT